MRSRKIRCAIYTRKSSDEGLEQEFNSLDAQYEACAAYIASQRHEGWKLVPTRYDDGGLSGGSLDRPALQALLADIDAGRIDMIVLYKIDRLTRSLSDFSKIVDRLDAAEASFVSVTQSFNTATSMGRLTLNMLLSFAQFEREVTAERIRDKIAASKAKGIWMGGTIPLGYDRHIDGASRSLVISETEATTVRRLFALYDAHGCLAQVAARAKDEGLRSKPRNGENGRVFSRGAIHKLLTNPLYLGKITHKNKTYQGRHAPIIDQAVWERVQEKMQSASAKRRGSVQNPDTTAWLKGRLSDETGDRLTPSHTRKSGRIIRYYVSNRLLKGKDPKGWRLPARALEQALEKAILNWLLEDATSILPSEGISACEFQDVKDKIDYFAKSVVDDNRNAAIRLRELLWHAQVMPGQLKMTFDRKSVANTLGLDVRQINETQLTATHPFSLRRRGVEIKVIVGDQQPTPDQTLQRTLAKAHLWLQAMKKGATVEGLAKANATSSSYIRTRLSLATLSPRIQKAIMDGTQPPDLTTLKLLRMKLPLDWAEQEQALGL